MITRFETGFYTKQLQTFSSTGKLIIINLNYKFTFLDIYNSMYMIGKLMSALKLKITLIEVEDDSVELCEGLNKAADTLDCNLCICQCI